MVAVGADLAPAVASILGFTEKTYLRRHSKRRQMRSRHFLSRFRM